MLLEQLEVIIFDEPDEYREKIKGLTFRQWIFVAIMLVVIVPTYLLLPKFTPITENIASYIVILEAAIIGFFGFVRINNLNAEQIVPYWYRHYVLFSHPITYITDEEWAKTHEKKNKKAQNTSAANVDKTINESRENSQSIEETSDVLKEDKGVAEIKEIENVDFESPQVTQPKQQLSKKELKKQQKQQKMLEKARKKYSYLSDDSSNLQAQSSQPSNVQNVQKEQTVFSDKNIEALSAEEKKRILRKLIDSD